MRTAILAGLIAATLTPAVAQAQSYGEVRRDRQDIREEQRDVRRAIRNGASPGEIRDQRQDVREARREYRQDWRDYRRAHPDVYRGQAWVGPRGYAYRPVVVGNRFRADLYDRRYWVDPYRYRLRPVYGAQRWVRYGRDVLLVDTRNGRVIEVDGNFFY